VEQTDKDIAREVQEGGREAFGVLVLRYQPKMARYARKFLFRGDDVADLVQDIFMKAYANIQSFDVRRRFSPWIYRIAHNIFLNAMRDNAKDRANLSLFDVDVLFPHPIAKEKTDDGAKREEMKRMLDTSLGSLAPKYREPIVLYYFEEFDYKTISQILQIPVSTIATRIKQGKLMLGKTVNPSVL
jgi:RNA polymerase sigma-70 factor (ECF subfamily)